MCVLTSVIEYNAIRCTGAVLLPEKASLFGLERLAFWCPFEPEKASLLGLDLTPKG